MKYNKISNISEKSEEDLIVGYSDYFHNKQIYNSSIPRYTILGSGLGAIIFGIIAWLMASGIWPIAYLGQLSASGDGVATLTGVGVGLAIGGLIGGLIALNRLYRYKG